MTDEERRDVGDRVRAFFKLHDSNQTQEARDFCKRAGISVAAAKVKINRIVKGKFEADMDFFAYLYEKYEANIGFLITGKGSPHVKSFK